MVPGFRPQTSGFRDRRTGVGDQGLGGSPSNRRSKIKHQTSVSNSKLRTQNSTLGRPPAASPMGPRLQSSDLGLQGRENRGRGSGVSQSDQPSNFRVQLRTENSKLRTRPLTAAALPRFHINPQTSKIRLAPCPPSRPASSFKSTLKNRTSNFRVQLKSERSELRTRPLTAAASPAFKLPPSHLKLPPTSTIKSQTCFSSLVTLHLFFSEVNDARMLEVPIVLA